MASRGNRGAVVPMLDCIDGTASREESQKKSASHTQSLLSRAHIVLLALRSVPSGFRQLRAISWSVETD